MENQPPENDANCDRSVLSVDLGEVTTPFEGRGTRELTLVVSERHATDHAKPWDGTTSSHCSGNPQHKAGRSYHSVKARLKTVQLYRPPDNTEN
jgi:hypothetical protein